MIDTEQGRLERLRCVRHGRREIVGRICDEARPCRRRIYGQLPDNRHNSSWHCSCGRCRCAQIRIVEIAVNHVKGRCESCALTWHNHSGTVTESREGDDHACGDMSADIYS